jgi:hypothetical protein
MSRRLVGCFLGLIAFVPIGQAASDSDARARKVWDAAIAAHAGNGDFSGIVLVTRRGEKVYEKTAGLASRSFDVPIRPDTRFVVASVTKTFTAAGIALLEKEESSRSKIRSTSTFQASRRRSGCGICSATSRGSRTRTTTRSQPMTSRPIGFSR